MMTVVTTKQLCFQMEGVDDLEGELRDEEVQQDSPDDSQVSYCSKKFNRISGPR